jgi:hypothetical protein
LVTRVRAREKSGFEKANCYRKPRKATHEDKGRGVLGHQRKAKMLLIRRYGTARRCSLYEVRAMGGREG